MNRALFILLFTLFSKVYSYNLELEPKEIPTNINLNSGENKLMTNVASKAFTWITGTREQAHYEPVGELANYFGFAKLRNEIRDASKDPQADENFRGSSWTVVLEHLNREQREVLYELSNEQEPLFLQFLDKRVELIDHLYDLKRNIKPDPAELTEIIISMSRLEGQISIISSRYYGRISQILTEEQDRLFKQIRAGELTVKSLKGEGWYTTEVEHELKSFDKETIMLLTEIASKFLSYETGDLNDAIFLPSGKIGNFYGFASYRYVDRAKVSRKQAANNLLETLTEEQTDIIRWLTKLIYPLEQQYIAAREGLIRGIYPMKSGNRVNEKQLLSDYIEGSISEGYLGVIQAVYFNYLESRLSDDQIKILNKLR